MKLIAAILLTVLLSATACDSETANGPRTADMTDRTVRATTAPVQLITRAEVRQLISTFSTTCQNTADWRIRKEYDRIMQDGVYNIFNGLPFTLQEAELEAYEQTLDAGDWLDFNAYDDCFVAQFNLLAARMEANRN